MKTLIIETLITILVALVAVWSVFFLIAIILFKGIKDSIGDKDPCEFYRKK